MLAALMVASAAGCAPKVENSSGTGSNSTEGKSTLTKYKKPITLTWMSPTSEDYPLGSDPLKKTMDKIAEATNVTVQWKMIPSSDANAMYTTMLLSGRKQWPNLVTKDLGTINDDGVRGAYADLTTDLKSKMPNVYKKLNAYNRWSDLVNLNSKQIFGVPRVGQQVCAKSWMIRKDWLDACGLSEPKTVEEFANCLKAFKEKNPGGAPADKNYPFVCRQNPQEWMSTVFGSWGMNSIYYTEEKDGTLKLDLNMDEFRECMTYWHNLYKDGLIDPEVLVGDASHWMTCMNNSYSGATIDYTVRTNQFTNAIRSPSADAVKAGVKAQPKAQLIGLAPLTSGSRTTATIAGNDPINTSLSVGIMSNCTAEQKEAAECLINYIYSDEGSKLLSWGIDGVSYDGLNSDGSPKWKDKLINNYSIKVSNQYGIQPSIARPVTKDEVLMLFPSLAKEAMAKNDGHYETRHSTMYLSDAEWKEHGDAFTILSKFYIEACSQFLSGKRTLDDAGWAKFQNDIKGLKAGKYMELTQKGTDQAKKLFSGFTL
jgi:ABC-type glycerol-3-phosphate transport system substrate-binding protein